MNTAPPTHLEVYEDTIAPLARKIAKTCKEHGIPLLLAFQTNDDGKPAEIVTTAGIPSTADPSLLAAYECIRPAASTLTTTRTGPGGKVLAVETMEG